MEYEVTKIDDSTWALSEGFVRFFLLAGEVAGEPRQVFGTTIQACDVKVDTLLVQ